MLFDLFVIFVTLLATLLLETLDHDGARWRTTVRVVLSLRLIRLLRVLWNVSSARRVVVSFFTLLPAAAALLTTTLNFMLFFAAMGIDLFGGGITTDTSGAIISREDAETLGASAFGESGYYPASFNDLPSAIVTLFILLVVNDWNVVVSGYVAVWGIKARVFFAIFYLSGVVIMLNILIAFVIETYHQVDEHHQETATRLTVGAAMQNDTFSLQMPRLARSDDGGGGGAAAEHRGGGAGSGLAKGADGGELGTVAEVDDEEEPSMYAVELQDISYLRPTERRELLVRLVTPLGVALHRSQSTEFLQAAAPSAAPTR